MICTESTVMTLKGSVRLILTDTEVDTKRRQRQEEYCSDAE